MHAEFPPDLKSIRFVGELLPKWAQLLDVAARLCPLAQPARDWFSRFTASAGVDDSRTIKEHCQALRQAIQQNREVLLTSLTRFRVDPQPAQVFAAWMYSLDTMLQQAESSETCSWFIENGEDEPGDAPGGGEVNLRRV